MNEKESTKLSQISNIIFLTITIFCLFFLWSNYYTKDLRISLISSFVVIFAFLIIYIPIYIKKRKGSITKKIKEKELKNLSQNLLYSSESHILNLFITLLKDNEPYNIISTNHLLMNNTDIFFLFYHENTINIEFEKIYKYRKTNNINIYCISKPTQITNVENLKIKFFELEDIYNFLQTNSINFEEQIIVNNKPKINIKTILQAILNKSKSRSYLTIGILLFFSSLFTPFSIYYIVMSTILILLAIFCRFNTKYN